MFITIIQFIVFRIHKKNNRELCKYGISSNKRQTANKHRPLLSAAPLGILIYLFISFI